jgi:hypothetical protein
MRTTVRSKHARTIRFALFVPVFLGAMYVLVLVLKWCCGDAWGV